MDFGSIRRKNRVSQPSRRKTFSASNLSCISCNSASVSKKSVYVTLPRDSGCEVNLDGKILHIRRAGPAHAVGVLQIGDYLRIVEDHDDSLVKLQVTFGVLQVEMRPDCPLVIEIGNRSHTSLGIALADSPDNKIQISSIQPGSLADRCGYLQPGDILSSVHTANEAIPCAYYNSYQVAQILRQLTGKNSSVKLTIVPSSSEDFFLRQRDSCEDIDVHSGGSDSTLTLVDDSPNYSGGNQNPQPGCFISGLKPGHLHKRQISKVDEIDEENGYVMSMCLWKDPLYEDWGFSLVDQSEDAETEDESDEKKLMEKNPTNKSNGAGAVVYQIRPGGPAFVAGLRSSDRIIEINGRDVSELESTMLVPILASLEDALNICILRMPSKMDQ